ncbi:alkylation response protein AidB-like acyl-CoA dehydrogenase [Halorubrum trapanicum]|uniref:Alkylation response protein AidB-like acyl-CoA dehydrogenase n=1 Tax=Halorubrum trapanicum TaxID=29284 RepID=A0A8J7RCB4_9EURY|nr:acyl-CoA dehydrogenase family protein [Halorubrum trapanicum]MBP1901421.1 alkylation response protein AidB-like acyl-CoA dehydrogenase [Halorubrum trapanicum]
MTGARVGSALTDEQAAIRDLVEEFAAEEVRPTAAAADETETFPEDVWDGLAELGLTGLTVPEEHGGFGADETTYAVVNEALAHGSLAVATALSVHCLATSCLAEFGTDEQRETWLPEMAETGRPVGMFCLSEPHAGSNPAEMSTTATYDADTDEYVLNGEKQWITNGRRGGVAIVFAKVAREDGDGGPDETDDAITQFLVPADTDGFEVGKKEEKLGLRASDTTGITFDDCRVPAENRLTEPGKGLSAAFRTLTEGRIGIAAQAVGVAQAALDEAESYATEREQFDRPIADIQTIRHKVAEMSTDVSAARLLVREACRQAEAGEDYRVAASKAKYRASEAATSVTNEAVQIHGGYGYTTEFDVERLYRDAKITEIYEGTTEIQKTIIARGVFGE